MKKMDTNSIRTDLDLQQRIKLFIFLLLTIHSVTVWPDKPSSNLFVKLAVLLSKVGRGFG